MSLRDQLVAKGLASKKDATRVKRELKQKRKKKQGARRRKKLEVAEQRAAEAAELQAKHLERVRGRKLREQERERLEHLHRVRRIVLDNQLRVRGKLRFFHKRVDGRRVSFLDVSEKVAFKLRCGELAIAAVKPARAGEEETYAVVPLRSARKLEELEPELVVFRVTDTGGIADPDEGFLDPDWDVSLTPHRYPGR